MKNTETSNLNRVLNRGLRNAGNAIIKDGKIFIDDIMILHDAAYKDISLTVCNQNIDMATDANIKNGVFKILNKVENINNRRVAVRSFIQKISDKITKNNEMRNASDDEIWAWFALEKMNKNILQVRYEKVGRMHNFSYGDIRLSHLPAEEAKRVYFVSLTDAAGCKLIDIKPTTNKSLFARADTTFFNMFSKMSHGRLLEKTM